jgi:hypothetical protein
MVKKAFFISTALIFIFSASIAGASISASNLPMDVKAFGAKGDGITNDTAAFAAAAAALGTRGGIVQAGAGVFYIAGPLAIPDGVFLVGTDQNPGERPNSGYTAPYFPSMLIVDGANPITLGSSQGRCGVMNMLIIEKNISPLGPDPLLRMPFSNSTNAQNAVNAFSGTLFRPYTNGVNPVNIYDIKLENLLVLGFGKVFDNTNALVSLDVGQLPWTNTTGHESFVRVWGGTVSSISVDGTQLYTGTNHGFNVSPYSTVAVTYTVAPTITYEAGPNINLIRSIFRRVYFDCTNGIFTDHISDVGRFEDCHGWPFSTNGIISGSTRTGTAYYFGSMALGAMVSRCFSFGFQTAFENWANGMLFSDIYWDGPYDGSTTRIGFKQMGIPASVELIHPLGTLGNGDSDVYLNNTFVSGTHGFLSIVGGHFEGTPTNGYLHVVEGNYGVQGGFWAAAGAYLESTAGAGYIGGGLRYSATVAPVTGDATAVNNCRINGISYVQGATKQPVKTATNISVTASKFTWTNTLGYPVVVAVYGGTVSEIDFNGHIVAAATNWSGTVPSGQAVAVTYSSLPTMTYLPVE